MSKILDEVLSANGKYAASFGDKSKLAISDTLPPAMLPWPLYSARFARDSRF